MNKAPIAITCGYLTLPQSGAQLHYRMAGAGPPLVMLHPSPQNSQAMEPAMAVFAKTCTCIAIDTPGYGLSDDPTAPDAELKDYAEIIFAAADALGLERFLLYGVATGAQIAIEMGKQDPERLALVLLDANGHIDPQWRERIMQSYFPPVTPVRDGGHLLTLWDMCSSLFTAFPWNSEAPGDRLPIPRLPAETAHQTMLRYLDAREGYAKAYRKAFDAEDIRHFEGFRAPAVMTRWEGSAVLRIADALIAQGLPENVRVLDAGPSLEERFSVQLSEIRYLLERESFSSFSGLPQSGVAAARRDYAVTCAGQLHLHRSDEGSASRAVFLHGAGRSSRRWEHVLEELAGKRPYLAIDLPGHGHSRVPLPDRHDIEAFAAPIIEALQLFATDGLELVGEGLGGAIALAVQDCLTDCTVTILDPVPLTPEERAKWLAEGLVDCTPRPSGSHLIEGWHYLREKARRWPWFDGSVSAQRGTMLDRAPATLHAHLSDMLRLGSAHGPTMALEVELDWPALLMAHQGDVTIALTEDHPCPERAGRLAPRNRPLRRINAWCDLFD